MNEANPLDQAIARVRQGDTEAFTEVVLATQDRLRAYIIWACPDPNTAEDIAQEVYLYAWRNMQQYEIGTDLQAWLKTIARYRILKHAERLSAQAQREKRHFDELLFNFAAQPDASLATSERQDEQIVILRGCLRKLPPKQLELIRQRYERNLDANALAKLLNRSVASIRVNLFRIREQLRRCVKAALASEGAKP